MSTQTPVNRVIRTAIAVTTAALLMVGCTTGIHLGTASDSANPTTAAAPSTAPVSSTTPATNTNPIDEPTGTSSADEPTSNPAEQKIADDSCLNFKKPEQLRACTAYVLNATYLARLPFYKECHSANPAVATLALSRLESRYTGAALAQLKSQVASVPAADPISADLPKIWINSVTVSADGSTATLNTLETWIVRSGASELLQEANQPHTVTMTRKPGIILEKWVVTAIS